MTGKEILATLLVVVFLGCGGVEEVEKDAVPVGYPKIIKVYGPRVRDYKIVVYPASDGHEYMLGYGMSAQTWTHYPDCGKCIKAWR